jgi:RNA polymerase subunit RPABC4/transcription elongation factor Spt4
VPPRKLAIWLLIPAILEAQSAPLWPGARYTVADRDAALERGLNFIYHTASDPAVFADWGHDLLWCFYTISATSKNPKLREMARKMGHERALEWRRINPTVPVKISVDEVASLLYGSDAADRLGARDPGYKQQLRNAVRGYTVTDFLLFDPAREPPPSDIPDQCAKCKRWNDRGVTVCRYCGAPLTMRNRYDVWTDALIITYSGEIYGVRMGAPYRDVIRWIPVMRPYPARASVSTGAFYDVTYAITHVIYTLNDYNRYLLSPEWLPQEYQYLKTNLEEAVKLQDPETLGEFLDTLRDFGMTERDPLIRAGVDYALSKQNSDGSWGDLTDPDIYSRYHSTWTAIDGLREYGFHGKRLSFPSLEPLVRGSAAPVVDAGR